MPTLVFVATRCPKKDWLTQKSRPLNEENLSERIHWLNLKLPKDRSWLKYTFGAVSCMEESVGNSLSLSINFWENEGIYYETTAPLICEILPRENNFIKWFFNYFNEKTKLRSCVFRSRVSVSLNWRRSVSFDIDRFWIVYELSLYTWFVIRILFTTGEQKLIFLSEEMLQRRTLSFWSNENLFPRRSSWWRMTRINWNSKFDYP